jgi:ankyrin repeat protein
MRFLRMGCFGMVLCTCLGVGLAIFGNQRELRDISISPDGRYVVRLFASPMLFSMPGGGSDASGDIVLQDAAGQELNRKSIEMVQLAAVKWLKDRVEVDSKDTWTLPSIANINILLFSAAYTGNKVEFDRLLDRGANLQLTTTFGQTLLHAAAVGQNDAIAQQILSQDLAIDAIDNNGQTALHLGAGRNNSIVKHLLDKGANPNIVDLRGRTALAVAAAEGNLHNVRVLLDRGADVNLTNSYESPLWLAISKVKSSPAQLALVQLLLDRGAKVTPGLLDLAPAKRDPQLGALLKRHSERTVDRKK